MSRHLTRDPIPHFAVHRYISWRKSLLDKLKEVRLGEIPILSIANFSMIGSTVSAPVFQVARQHRHSRASSIGTKSRVRIAAALSKIFLSSVEPRIKHSHWSSDLYCRLIWRGFELLLHRGRLLPSFDYIARHEAMFEEQVKIFRMAEDASWAGIYEEKGWGQDLMRSMLQWRE